MYTQHEKRLFIEQHIRYVYRNYDKPFVDRTCKVYRNYDNRRVDQTFTSFMEHEHNFRNFVEGRVSYDNTR